jgi:DNA-binding NtrC family response regulator
VRVAKNGLEAIAALGEAPADVVVTDINMPDMDGIEMVIALQETAPEVPVIAMSGGGLFETGLLLDSAAALGAFRTLEKPFDPSELRDAIDAALGEASGGTEGG